MIPMEWTRSETIAMASASCVFCRGLGIRYTEKLGKARPCPCVFRAIFRACLDRYRACQSASERIKPISYEYKGGPRSARVYGRRNEEFMADFEAISRRTLDAEDFELLKLFHFKGLDYNGCAARLNRSRGVIFHSIYDIQQKLGRAFRETEPYSLFPLDEYFSGIALRKVVVLRVADPESDAPRREPVVARTNPSEMPRCGNRVARRFPSRPRVVEPIDRAA